MRRSTTLGLAAASLGLLACAPQPSPRPNRLLGNPITDARTAIAKGDLTYLGVLRDSLTVPGLEGTDARIPPSASLRVFSQRSLGVTGREWLAQRDSLTTYAAAYNLLMFEARGVKAAT
jgi:hypothetical protein